MRKDGIFKPLWHSPSNHIIRLIFKPDYRRYNWLVTRYSHLPRYRKTKISVRGWNLIVPDIASFLNIYKMVFLEEIYAFNSSKRNPVILDGGANIGLSVLYFKQKYPEAKVIAYEADPTIFSILKKNIQENGITGVELINKAIWDSESEVDFSVEGADGGRIDVGNDKNIIKVPTVSLSSILEKDNFDFVKLDIEGAETQALKGCEDYIKDLSYVFVEFHSFTNKKQDLGNILNIFENNGFRVHIHPESTTKRPFMGINAENNMDMQLNLFFWKATK